MRIDIIIGIVERDNVKYPKKMKVDTNDEFNQYYPELEKARVKLDKLSNNLVGFLIGQMDDRNIIYVNKMLKFEFNTYITDCIGRKSTYSNSAIDNAFTTLRKENILIPSSTKGVNYINPALVFKGSQRERVALVKRINTELIRTYSDLKIEEPELK